MRRTPTRPLPAASLCPQVHARRRRTAGRSVDEAHETLSVARPRAKILEREYQQYQQREYERLAGISRWPRSIAWAAQRLPPAAAAFQPRPGNTAVSIGERRRPDPQRPTRLSGAWIRCLKGIAMVSRASTTSMPWMKSPSGKGSAPQPQSVKPGLEPLLKAMIEQFPFRIRGFHSDQRQRVPPSHGGEVIEQASDRTDPVASAALQRQRLGGIEKTAR